MATANAFARIVVGYDGSIAAETGLRAAAALVVKYGSEKYGGKVVALHRGTREGGPTIPVRSHSAWFASAAHRLAHQRRIAINLLLAIPQRARTRLACDFPMLPVAHTPRKRFRRIGNANIY